MDREEKVLKSLANKKRLDILRILKNSTHGISVKEIAKKIKLSEQSASKHLMRLDSAGLIKKDRKGMYIISYVPLQIWKMLSLLNQLYHRGKK